MSVRAYILVETAVGKIQDVARDLRDLSGVEVVNAVTGPYDLIAVINAPDLNAVGDVVTGKIHTINGITRTVTCLSLKST